MDRFQTVMDMQPQNRTTSESHITEQLTFESLNGQNLGRPRRPYFKSCAPFFSAVIAFIPNKCSIISNTLKEFELLTSGKPKALYNECNSVNSIQITIHP